MSQHPLRRQFFNKGFSQQKLLQSRHSSSVLQMIQQIRYVNDLEIREDRAIVLRAIVSKHTSPEQKKNEPYLVPDQMLMLPRKAELFNKKNSEPRLRKYNSRHSPFHTERPDVKVQLQPETLVLIKPALKNLSSRRSIGDVEEIERQFIAPKLNLPSISRKGSKSKQIWATDSPKRKLLKNTMELSGWSDHELRQTKLVEF